jgi:[ribosomal protein S5]-alanine N-acetyltransferase
MRVPSPTKRLSFRAWSAEDLPIARSLWGDPAATSLIGGPFDDNAIRARLEIELANQRDHQIAYWLISLHDVEAEPGPAALVTDREIIGCAGLRPRDPERQIYELGFSLRRPWWGCGLASEAGRAVIVHAFDVLGATSLFAGHHPDNHASRRALEKLGFRYSHDELYPLTGRMHPSYRLDRGHRG